MLEPELIQGTGQSLRLRLFGAESSHTQILPHNMVRLRVKSLITRVHGLWQSYKACFAAYGEHAPVI